MATVDWPFFLVGFGWCISCRGQKKYGGADSGSGDERSFWCIYMDELICVCLLFVVCFI